MTTSSRHLAWPFWFAIFLGAWLIFQIQPLMSKLILPWFGGTPQVWTVCLLFFQTVLFAGYLFAHALVRYGSPRWQGILYLGLLILAALITPIMPGDDWKPDGQADPTWQILLLLLRFIGLPYLLLSATGPLLQAWHHRAIPAQSPYWLYALSNTGSLLGLLAYPFAIDLLLPASDQVRLWLGCYLAYVIAAGVCGMLLFKSPPEAAHNSLTGEVAEVHTSDRLLWFGLAMIPTVLLAAVTNKLCTDISPIPFLWVLPLTIYLLSFVLCFSDSDWYSRMPWGLALAASLAQACTLLVMARGTLDYGQISVQFFSYLALLLSACMVCHGELVRLKPHQRHLTEFYLWMSGGGAAGGFLTGVVAPRLFPFYLELHLAMIGSYVLLLIVCFRDASGPLYRGKERLIWAVLGLGFVSLTASLAADIGMTFKNARHISRNFYGVLRINEHHQANPDEHTFELAHGGTLHGVQYVDPIRRRWPTTYYGETSGVGLALRFHHTGQQRRIGAVGLGVGTLASYGRPEDSFDFFEINPLVVSIAESQFHYLKDSAAKCQVILGDARISLDQMPARGYDILALDAFSSDAVPIHLLTEEAFEIYLKHLSTDGIIACHVSNRYLNLLPVMAGHAHKFGLTMASISDDGDQKRGTAYSIWVLLSAQPSALKLGDLSNKPLLAPKRMLHWTDAHSNLLSVWGSN